MKKTALMAILGLASTVLAQTIILEGVDGSTTTTGDLIDEADEIGLTTNVVEIPGLLISVRSGGANQDVNSLTTSLGIDSDGSEDDSDMFEDGESMIVSFSKDIEITQFDFNNFSSGEVFNITIDGSGFGISWDDLTSQQSDYLNTNIIVSAGIEIGFSVGSTNSIIGLDGITLNVVGGSGDPVLEILSSNGLVHVFATFDGAATTNHVLQSSTNLTTNVWTTVSGPFASDTNWNMGAVDHDAFFRIIAE